MNLKTKALLAALTLGRPAAAVAGIGLTRAGVESPSYEVVEKKDGFEVRKYPDLVIVSTKMDAGADREQQDARFMRLFRYIDRGNAEDQKIAMTTPVLMETGGKAGAMSFVLPAEVREAGAPQPKSEDVYLSAFSEGKYAALRFRGGRSASAEKQAVEKLRNALAAAGLKAAAGDPMFAYYDPPWTPRVLRRNEVLLRLAE